jgi:hypothetical protein
MTTIELPFTELGETYAHLSTRTINVLRRNGVFDVGTLYALSAEQLANLRNVGLFTINEVTDWQQAIKPYFNHHLSPVTILDQLANPGLDLETLSLLDASDIIFAKANHAAQQGEAIINTAVSRKVSLSAVLEFIADQLTTVDPDGKVDWKPMLSARMAREALLQKKP